MERKLPRTKETSGHPICGKRVLGVFQAAVGAFLASTAAAASMGSPVARERCRACAPRVIGDPAIEMLADRDRQARHSCAGRAARRSASARPPTVTVLSRATMRVLFMAQNGVEIDGAERHERTRRIARRARERRVVLRDEAIGEIRDSPPSAS